jgi:outer membrane protein OmpA-like peptidoglycan-associated protein
LAILPSDVLDKKGSSMKRALLPISILASIAFVPALSFAQSTVLPARPIVTAQNDAAKNKDAQQSTKQQQRAKQKEQRQKAQQQRREQQQKAQEQRKEQQQKAQQQRLEQQKKAQEQQQKAREQRQKAQQQRREQQQKAQEQRKEQQQKAQQQRLEQQKKAQEQQQKAREQRQKAQQQRREQQQKTQEQRQKVQQQHREQQQKVQDQREKLEQQRKNANQDAHQERRENRRLDALRGERKETKEGDRTIIRERDRTIVRQGNRAIIRHDDDKRFRHGGGNEQVVRRGDHTERVIQRPNGVRVVTTVDAHGRVIRRSRFVNGREYVLFRNRPSSSFNFIINVPPPVIHIPRERYIVEYRDAPPTLIYDTLIAPPVMDLDRTFSMDEVLYNYDVRARMPRIDIDSITFDSGSWDIRPDQAAKLEPIAHAMLRAIQANPNEVYLIEGHTDAVGTEDDNLSLSDRRAQAVTEVLTEEFGVPPENMIPQGYGEQNLKVPTQGSDERNRYVSVRRVTPLLAQQQ